MKKLIREENQQDFQGVEMFSQRDEEKYILKFFRHQTGCFLDIGAHNGKCFSTTHALASKGWAGVCIEPSPSVFPALKKLYESNDKIQTLEYAVSDITGEIDFYDSGGDLVSSIDEDHVKLWTDGSNCTFTKLKVNSLTVHNLFEKVGYDFEFINLDVEATNINIFEQFPLAKLNNLKMLCIEFDRQEDKILRLAEPYGFSLLHKTAENVLLTR